MNAQEKMTVTHNAFKVPSFASMIEDHIGQEMLRSVRGLKPRPLDKPSPYLATKAAKKRRAAMLDYLVSVKPRRVSAHEVAGQFNINHATASNDLRMALKYGEVNRDRVKNDRNGLSYEYWAT